MSFTVGDPVIVRAYGDEPVRMEIVAFTDKAVTCRRPNRVATINLPLSIIYPFNSIMLDALTSAYEGGDVRQLGALWSDARWNGK